MKKVIALLLVCVMVAGLFAGCDSKKKEEKDSCDHEWVSGTCTTPRTCKECDKTMGKAKGHQWAAADCESPKTCTRCDAVDGEPLGHTWEEATCTEPQVCKVCEAIGDDALGHDMKEATVDAPSTCSRCDHTEGVALGQPLTVLEKISDTNTESGNDIVMGTWKDVKGNTHEETLRFWVKNAEGFNNEEEIVYNLDGKYSLLTGTIALGDETQDMGSGYFTIYADGWRVYNSLTMSSYSNNAKFEVDLTDVDTLTIVCTTYSSADSYLLFNAQVHK